MRRVFQVSKLQEIYEPKGYANFNFLSPEEVNGIPTELQELRPDDNFSPRSSQGAGYTYHCSFIDHNREYRQQVDALIWKYFSSHVEKHLNSFRILNCNFYGKPPRSGTFVVHQNCPAIDDLDDTTVTLWCPLVDVAERNGALQVVAGSHKITAHVESLKTPPYFRDFTSTMINKYLRPIPMHAGEAIVFDDGLVHWSANHDSDDLRITIQILWIPDNIRLAYWYFDEQFPNRFELIDADTDFWLNTDHQDLMQRQTHWGSLGFAPNQNRMLSEEDFAALLDAGPTIRSQQAQRWAQMQTNA